MTTTKHLVPQLKPKAQLQRQLLQAQPVVTAVATVAPPSRPDRTDEFWRLFSAWNFVQAAPPAAGKKPDWKAVNTYPIAQRLASQGRLIAVRPQTKTHFLTIDIDATSRNHFTQQNEYAIARLQAALEERLGLVESIVVRSSDSGGIHLWYWFEAAQNAYQLAAAVAIVLKEAGFVLEPGHLETFPNCKAWIDSENPTDWSQYQAIRVPFQEPGSYLLDPDNYYAPLLHRHADQRQEFLRLVKHSQRRNAVTSAQIEAVLATRPQPFKHVSVKGNQYLSDLLSLVRDGWTGSSQTRDIFFATTRLIKVFGHLLLGVAPFRETERLADAILAYVLELPGREEFCRHNHELDKKAREWAEWAQGKYTPFDHRRKAFKAEATVATDQGKGELTHNQQQRETARERILQAIAQLLNQNQLPATISARRDALEALGVHRATLYRHRDLWHPKYPSEPLKPLASGGVTPVTAKSDPSEPLKRLPGGGVTPVALKKLVPHSAAPSGQAGRSEETGGSGGKSTGAAAQPVPTAPEPNNAALNPEKATTEQVDSPTPAAAKATLNPEKATTEPICLPTEQTAPTPSRESHPVAPSSLTGAAAVIAQWVTEKRQRQAAAKLAQQEAWLASGDPILVKEAQAWFDAQTERKRSQLGIEETDPGG